MSQALNTPNVVTLGVTPVERTLGDHLRSILYDADISQDRLAQFAGVSRSVVRDLIDGRYNPAPENLRKISAALLELNKEAFVVWFRFFLPPGVEVYTERSAKPKPTADIGQALSKTHALEETAFAAMADGVLTDAEVERIQNERAKANAAWASVQPTRERIAGLTASEMQRRGGNPYRA